LQSLLFEDEKNKFKRVAALMDKSETGCRNLAKEKGWGSK
jgi:hypothetical protein